MAMSNSIHKSFANFLHKDMKLKLTTVTIKQSFVIKVIIGLRMSQETIVKAIVTVEYPETTVCLQTNTLGGRKD